MSDSVSARAYAKLTLFLRILGRKGDHHEIEALQQSVDLFDEITLTKRKDDLVTSDFEGDNSLVVLEELRKRFSLGGMHLSLLKNIPIGGGLGGSSADAAAAALACADLWELDRDRVKEIAAPLFGDIAFQMTGGTALARGFGERLQLLPPLPSYWVLLAFPKEGVSTERAYALSDEFPKGEGKSGDLLASLRRGERAQKNYCNDLISPAKRLNGEIARLLDEIGDEAALLTGMSGSGSTLFALYTAREQAALRAKELPCRTLLTRTISPFLGK